MKYAALLIAFLHSSNYCALGILKFEDEVLKEGDSCFTNSRSLGECRDVRICKTLSSDEKIISKGCGWKGDIPIICCPLPLGVTTTEHPKQVCGIRPSVRSVPNQTLLQRSAQEVQVVGGKQVVPNSWPWMVSLRQGTDPLSQHRCGGCVISSYHILTAAHCFVKNSQWSLNDYIVRAGGHTRDDGTNYRVVEIIAHPMYQIGIHYNDIAIIKVEKPIDLKILPACLPSTGDAYTHKTATVLGWGDTSFGGVSSNVLQEANVNVMTTSDCDSSYSNLNLASFPKGIINSLLCAGVSGGGKDACQGDSGGPLMFWDASSLSWKIIGVVSFGFSCGSKEYPGVYTKVSSYLSWIKANSNS